MAEETENHWRLHIFALLAVCAAVALAVELGARWVMPRISKIDSRTLTEQLAANKIGTPAAGEKTLLIIGNSLMRSGINIPQLQQAMRPRWQVRRLIVENTDYLDWYYGLRKLFADGNRPTAVALMLTPRQLLAGGVRGEYTSYYLFSAADTLRVGVRAHYHPTQISSMLVGHYSAYYGKRIEIRKVAFQKVVPDAVALVSMLMPEAVAKDVITPAQIDELGGARLAEIKALCSAFHVRLVFLVPTPQHGAPALDRVAAVAERLGLASERLAVGFGEANRDRDGIWPDKFFDTDHWHFSEEGAAAYTARLAPALEAVL